MKPVPTDSLSLSIVPGVGAGFASALDAALALVKARPFTAPQKRPDSASDRPKRARRTERAR